ncbi:hypothetical protein [Asticcacaulis excentricus]|uniref:Uncharacterized protein n=1 Tax=Asticcacaulis excentricus (strain ATCC 15261 / DSM 4724 / KCTC 12464 / NCIMB 9791 / VKM B-1370 / CB 48) TaxID=573065 RepID=E8RQZ3_ASTEC|nr:hypothetical protein [Asticcacaulis excentricus]ADU12256.1 hypothetical protein Astex_0568 [Asticcacaulis excentricus CB 48]
MRRLSFILGLSIGLSLYAAPPSWGAATDAQREAVKKLPHDLKNLMESAYYCRGLTGEKPYAEAKSLTLSVLSQLTDATMAERFVSEREKSFEADCPQEMRSTCWADYLDVPANESEVGAEECDIEQKLAMAAVVLTLQTIRGTSAGKN